MAEILKKCASEAESIVAKVHSCSKFSMLNETSQHTPGLYIFFLVGRTPQELATAGKGLTMAMIKEAMDNIRGAVMIIWPMGLPEYETVREIIDGTEDLTGTSVIR
ncbi:MAG: hypothetical protein BJ554DRAFT_4766 [Olpidium bornovanus]|uniref:Uncharacterized protein n=1 Tax=Olpidium bornovanus TaxID=278681 RepID=A0A8H8A060_9FUNG|nr:MAG: hypothetical protein BJ554DRAFT_4766 [Olpidium bornovanus]